VYYPYIHVTDKAWLNATLLWFPHLVRLIPEHYPLKDESWLKSYLNTEGTREKNLVHNVEFWNENIENARAGLTKKILEDLATNEADFTSRYGRDATIHKQKHREDTFTISRDRLIGVNEEYGLGQLLVDRNLAWKVSDRAYGVNPVLGEAIMATLAMSYAEPRGMDLVTHSRQVHDIVANRKTDAIYEALVRKRNAPPQEGAELADDVASLVIFGAFEVGTLSAADIVELQKNREDLSAFRNAVASIVSDVPGASDRAERDEFLRERANQIVEQWKKSRLSLSKLAKSVFSFGAVESGKDATKEIAEAFVAGTVGTLSFASMGAGLAVGILWHSAKRVTEEYRKSKDSELRWLTKIHRKTSARQPLYFEQRTPLF
jgi:hypothetical protein